jgi:hypothetical protein
MTTSGEKAIGERCADVAITAVGELGLYRLFDKLPEPARLPRAQPQNRCGRISLRRLARTSERTSTSLQDQLLIADTGLTRDILGAYLDSIPARQKLVILDACFASSTISSEDVAPTETYRDLDAAVLASAIGRAFAKEEDSPSVFTGHLIDVLHESTGEETVWGYASLCGQNQMSKSNW